MQKRHEKIQAIQLRRETLRLLEQGRTAPLNLAKVRGGVYTYPPVCDHSQTAC